MGDVVRNSTLAVREEGAGEPVLLLHAFPVDGRVWAETAAILAPTARVIAPDLRGFGLSTHRGMALTLDEHADDVAAVLAARALSRVTVVGLSMGGYIALALLRRHPDVVARLALVGARAGADTAEVQRGRNENIALVHKEGVSALVERMLPKLLHRRAPTSTIDEVRRIAEEQTPESVTAALVAMRDRPDATPWLAPRNVPIAIIVGEDDQLFSPTEARSLASAIEGAALELIPQAGHLVPCEAPMALARAVTRLLARG
jgi:3-oxoadipate enol-lactonase